MTQLLTYADEESAYPQRLTYQELQLQKQAEQMAPYLEAMQKKIDQRKNGIVYYAPNKTPEKDETTGVMVRPQMFYVANELGDNANPKPDWESPAFNYRRLKEIQEKHNKGLLTGSDYTDALQHGPIMPEWEEEAKRYYSYKLRGKTAGAITSKDFATIKTLIINAELLNFEERQFNLDQLFTIVNTANLTMNIDTYHRFTIGEEYRENEEVEARWGSITRQTFTLGRAFGHVAVSDEFFMDVRDHDVLALTLQNMNSEMTRIRNKKIGTVAFAGSTIAGADWSLFTGEHNTTNPYLNFNAAINDIDLNYGQANVAAMNTKTWQYLLSSTYVRDKLGGAQSAAATPRTVALPGLDGITIYLDNTVPDQKVIVADKQAGLWLQGPRKSAQYRDEHHMISGYYIREWHRAVIRTSGMLRVLTGVTP